MSAASMWYAQNAAQMSDGETEVWTGTGGTKGDKEKDEWAPYLQEWPVNPLGTGDYKVEITSDGEISVTTESDNATSTT
ncbi:MAG TPA: hypothetical protein VKY40_10610, partial [Halanaerobiales bacterium]|nr:hypothetical protein [Halanaerobiales bacterium]